MVFARINPRTDTMSRFDLQSFLVGFVSGLVGAALAAATFLLWLINGIDRLH